MERGDQSREHSANGIRCRACGCLQIDGEDSALDRLDAAGSTACRICGAPLRRRPRRAVSEASEISEVESHWMQWLEQRRLERWIWFGFLSGLALAVAAMAVPF